jgi:hypothetical protein
MTIESGTPVQLDGRQLNLSPHNIAALGLQVSGAGGLQGQNLTDRRDPVTASEFGDQSCYLLPARLLVLSVAADLRR